MDRFSYKKLEKILNGNPYNIVVEYSWRHSMRVSCGLNSHMVWFKLNGIEKGFNYYTNGGTYSLEESFYYDIITTRKDYKKYKWFLKTLEKYINSLGNQLFKGENND